MCYEERPVYSHVTFKLRSHVGWDGRRDGKRERGKDNFERIYNLEKRSNEALRKLRHKVIRLQHLHPVLAYFSDAHWLTGQLWSTFCGGNFG